MIIGISSDIESEVRGAEHRGSDRVEVELEERFSKINIKIAKFYFLAQFY